MECREHFVYSIYLNNLSRARIFASFSCENNFWTAKRVSFEPGNAQDALWVCAITVLVAGGAKGPGIFFVIPCIDTYRLEFGAKMLFLFAKNSKINFRNFSRKCENILSRLCYHRRVDLRTVSFDVPPQEVRQLLNYDELFHIFYIIFMIYVTVFNNSEYYVCTVHI